MLTEHEVKSLTGLTQAAAEERLRQQGYNELPGSYKRTIFHIIAEAVVQPMFLLLVACGVIYFLVGDRQEAVLMLAFMCLILVIEIYQEGKTERALEALQDLSSPRALVIRDGQQRRIPGREVVPEDILLIQEGDRVAADAVLIWGTNLTLDESLLTGESVPVRKMAALPDTPMGPPGGEDHPFLFSGTMAVKGQGVAMVKATGNHTEIGRIGRSIRELAPEKSLLQQKVGRLVFVIFIIAIVVCLMLVVTYGLLNDDWLKGALAGLTLALALLPEEFPIVLTIFLALGAWRISWRQVLTRKTSAIENLSALTVLCSDKTGTLTQNRMSVKKLVAGPDIYDVIANAAAQLPESFHELIEYGILASQKDPFDPMEKAFQELGFDKLANTDHLHRDWRLVREYPLSKDLLAVTHVWESRGESRTYIVAAKGAPEAIADLCHVSPEAWARLEAGIEHLAEEGLRVLAVAKGTIKKDHLPPEQHDLTFELVGLVGLEDPMRHAVPQAVSECLQAGIRVVMITGDYPSTAKNIAHAIGLPDGEHVLTGADLDRLSPEVLQQAVGQTNIFARVVPEQKLRIVNALKANGEIVAMTGDGVNDAPALKSAHVGIAMGERGTDVAREAAALVLMDDSFLSIVAAIKQGRRVYENLRKALSYLISIHIPIAGAALVPVIFQWPIEILSAIHVVFLELISDPVCTVVFEAEEAEPDIMKRPPEAFGRRILNRQTINWNIWQGLFSLFATLAAYQWGLMLSPDPVLAKTLAYTTLVLTSIGLILINRSRRHTILTSWRNPNPTLKYVLIASLGILGLALYGPFLQAMFGLMALAPSQLGIAFLLTFACIGSLELIKWWILSRQGKAVGQASGGF